MPDPADSTAYTAVSAEEFRRWLRMGIGRAVLYLREHDPEPYREVILDACLHNRVYDPQLEGTRGEYLVEVAESAGVLEIVRTHLLDAISTQSDDDWTLSQYVAFALVLAERGDARSLETFWRRFLFSDLWFAHDLVSHGDLEMFLLVADVVGVHTMALPIEDYDAAFLIKIAAEKHGADVLWATLEKATTANLEIAAFVRAARDPDMHEWTGISPGFPQIQEVSLSELQPLLGIKQRFRGYTDPTLAHWGKFASEQDFIAAAESLPMDLDNAWGVCRHLTIFGQRPFPGDPTPLIWIIRRASNLIVNWDAEPFEDGRRITLAALRALRNVRSPIIRQFALELMNDPLLRYSSTGLLVDNFEQGDYELIKTYIDGPLDEDEAHAAAHDVATMAERYPSPDAVPVLLALYERNPCSECRHKIVRALIDLNALPAWMARECRHDANIDTRALVAGLGNPTN